VKKCYFKYLIYGLCFISAIIFKYSFFSFLICAVFCFIFKNKAGGSENNMIFDYLRHCYILSNIVSFLLGNYLPKNTTFLMFLNIIIMYLLFIMIEIINHKTIKTQKTTTDNQGNTVCYFVHEEKNVSLAFCEIIFILFKIIFFIIMSRIISIDDLFILCDNIPYLGNLIVWLISDILIGGIFALVLFKIFYCIGNINKELFMRIIIPLVFLPINFYIIPSMLIMLAFGI